MRGNNPIRKPIAHDGSALEVKSIFATLQGEGPYLGWPSVFVRLGGCNLACAFCDTDFEDYCEMLTADIVEKIKSLAEDSSSPRRGEVGRGALVGTSPDKRPHPGPPPMGEGEKRVRHLVVITGGEPLRQNIAPLCEALLAEGFKVQIETNGTLWRTLPDGVDIICSPKTAAPIREDLLARVNAFKFLISARDAGYNHVGEVGQGKHNTPVYVQPMDEYDDARNAENQALALELAARHGYRLSLQTHKILGIE